MAGSSPTPLLRTFQCPQCGAKIELRAGGQSLVAACGSCASYIDVTDVNYKVISKAKQNMKYQPVIPLGTRGNVRGTKVEVLGMVVRQDNTGFYWREYLLFNPMKGFSWLVEANGHWSYVRTTKSRPKMLASYEGCELNGTHYRFFSTGTATVRFAAGEFYWRIACGEVVQVSDYVAPPEVLSMEKTKEEIIWSVGLYMQPEEVQSSFGLKTLNVVPTGIGINQPYPYDADLGFVFKGSIVFFLALIIVQMASPEGFFVNFMVFMILGFLFPFGLWMHHANFEGQRWGEDSFGEDLGSLFNGGYDE